jgi:hypothetical protein
LPCWKQTCQSSILVFCTYQGLCGTISLDKQDLKSLNVWYIKLSLFCFLFQFQYANFSSHSYKNTGKGSLKLQLINQRSDFSFALFTGGLANVSSYKLYPVISLFIKLIIHCYYKHFPFHGNGGYYFTILVFELYIIDQYLCGNFIFLKLFLTAKARCSVKWSIIPQSERSSIS